MPEPLASNHRTRRRMGPIVTMVAMVGLGLGLLWWFDPAKVYVPLCGFHALTGWHCPGCGAVRATHELLHGRWLDALRYNALWTLSLPLVFYVGILEWRVWLGRRPAESSLARSRRFWIVVAGVAVVFFVLRNLPYAPLTLLAPPV